MKKFLLITLTIILTFILTACGSETKDTTPNTISMFARELQLNQEQKATMQDIFTQCGIGEITSVKSIQNAETQSSYWLTDSDMAKAAIMLLLSG